MGMAASQVRFLSLQSRKNTIGLNLMTLSNRKLALSRDMNRVAAEYNEAMNQKVLKWSGDSGITYQGLNYDLLMKPNAANSTLPYIVTDAQGRVVVDDNTIELDGHDTGVSYRDLAMMISSYSGYSAEDQKTHYMNFKVDKTNGYTDNLSGADTGVTEDDIRNTNVTGENKATAGTANELGYEIVSTSNQLASNSLRYDLMEKLGLISKTEIEQINDLEIELYGPSKNPNAEKFPIGTLMGNYYLALANLEAYNVYKQNGDYVYAGGSQDPNDPTTATGSAPDKEIMSNDGTATITIKNDYAPTTGTNITFNGESSYSSKVDYTKIYDSTTGDVTDLTTKTEDIYTGTNENFSYTIAGGKIQYTYTASSLMTAMGKVDTTGWYSKKTWGKNRSNGSEIDGSTTWADLISQNKMIETYISSNFDNGNRSESALNSIVDSLATAIANNGAIQIDATALDKAKQSTKAFFNGKITNGGSINSDWMRPAHSQSTVEKKAINKAEESNLIGGMRKGDNWFTPGGRTYQAVSARNLYNTFITFYNYYYNAPTAAAIVDSSVGTFDSVNVTPTTFDENSYDMGSKTPFTYNGQKYIRIKVKDEDGSGIESYDYFKVDASGNIVGSAVQNDTYGTDAAGNKKVFRTIYNNDGSANGYEIQETNYNSQINVVGAGSAWTPNSSITGGGSGASAVPSGDVLTLTYTDEEGNAVEYKLGNFVKDSKYATTIEGSAASDITADLQAKVDEAAKAKDAAINQLDKLFDEKESKMMDYFDSLFKMIAENGWVYDENVNNTANKEESKNYLNAMLQNNMYFVTEVDTLDGTDFNYATKLATNVSKIFVVYDEDAQNTALSQYEAEKAEISSKEKQVDIRMNKLETEQDAIKTELDSLKKIIDDNVQATFKIFT